MGIPTTTQAPKPGREVFPLAERAQLDIAIPQTTPLYERTYTKLADLDPLTLPPLAKEADLDKDVRNRIDLVHGTIDVRLGSDEVEFSDENLPLAENLLSSLTRRVEKRARVSGHFAEIYPKVREYIRRRCFDAIVEIDEAAVRRTLNHSGLLDAIAELFARAIGQLTVEATVFRSTAAGVRRAGFLRSDGSARGYPARPGAPAAGRGRPR